ADFVLRLNGTDAEIHGDLPDAEPLFYDRTDNQWRFNSEVGIGDDDFKLLHTSPGASSSPTLQFDSGDFFRYRRNINLFDFLIASVNKMSIGPEGVIIDNGLVVGFSVAPVDDAVLVADADFGLFGGSSPALKFDTGTGVGDTLNYQRSADRFQFKIAGASVVQIELAIPLHLFPDPTSPLRGAVKFETQDTDPSAPSAHELFVHDDTDQLSWYDSRRQQAISAFVYELLQTSNALDDTPAGGTDQLFDFGGGPTDIKYPIPGITLRAGTVIRIVAGGAFSVGVADSLTFKVKIGGVSGAEVFDRGISLPVSSGDFYLEVSVTIRSLGAGTGVAYGTGMIAMTYGANDTVRARLRGNVAVTTTTLQDLVVTAAWGLQGNGNNVTMAVHNVEVQ
ncbi:MAG: hypothetical protein KAJ19_12540, partial [Gammaproteobacteria bacterium]|nr:hypothetical protein [Gammaproteobacteria bacterium]